MFMGFNSLRSSSVFSVIIKRLLLTFVFLLFSFTLTIADESNLCMNLKSGKTKLLAMGSVGPQFYVIDVKFNGLQVPLDNLAISDDNASLNLITGRVFSLTWTDVSLPKNSFTPDKFAGFLFNGVPKGTQVDNLEMIGVFSDDRKMFATKSLMGIRSGDAPQKVTIPSNVVFLTVSSNEANRFAYYVTTTGFLIFSYLTNLLDNKQSEPSRSSGTYLQGLKIDGGFVPREDLIVGFSADNTVKVIRHSQSLEIPYKKFFICKEEKEIEEETEEGDGMLFGGIIGGGTLLLLLVILSAWCFCRKKQAKVNNKSLKSGKMKAVSNVAGGGSQQIKVAPSIAGNLSKKNMLSTSWSRAADSTSPFSALSGASSATGAASTLSSASSATSKNSKFSAFSAAGNSNASALSAVFSSSASRAPTSSFAGGTSNISSAVSANSSTSKAASTTSAISSTSKATSKAASSTSAITSNVASSTAASSTAGTSKGASKATSPGGKKLLSPKPASSKAGALSKAASQATSKPPFSKVSSKVSVASSKAPLSKPATLKGGVSKAPKTAGASSKAGSSKLSKL